MATALLVACAACQPPSSRVSTVKPATGNAMVVDLDAVAKAMGWDLLIAQKVEAATASLNAQLLLAAESLEKEFKKLQADVGPSPTKEQLLQLQQVKLKVQQTIQSNKLVAEQARESIRTQQILLYRKEIKPVAARLAQNQQAQVVLIANQDVVWFDPATDITGKVIDEIRAKASTIPSEPAVAPDTSSASQGSAAGTATVTEQPLAENGTPPK